MDILAAMSDGPVDFDISEALIRTTNGKGVPVVDGKIILFDDNEYLDNYDPEKLLALVEKKKIPGVIVTADIAKNILVGLLEAYAALSCDSFDQKDRLRAGGKVRDILLEMRLL